MKQRATLGYLLLHANQVVATSDLVEALWPAGNPPATARKVLQNAVWGLRGILRAGLPGAGHGALLTRQPGYMLRVDGDQVDLEVFRRGVEDGRARLADGGVSAARILRDALELWRGPALADLVECGVAWPELSAVENARLDAMEDYFEAELAAGHHRAVLSDLERMVEAEPLRERLCGQLMLAFYRSGRQADALNVYGSVRARLVEDLGLEPRRELQTLQRRLLNQDAGLSLPEAAVPRETVEVRGRVAAPATAPSPPVPETLPGGDDGLAGRNGDAAPSARAAPAAGPAGTRPAEADPAPGTPRHRPAVPERRRGSILLLRADLQSPADVHDQRRADDIRDGVFRKIRDTVRAFGGTVMASIGSVSVSRFDKDAGDAGDAGNAVRAALALRCALDEPALPAGVADPRPAPPRLHAAVATGETVASAASPSGNRLLHSVNDAVLHKCQALLTLVPAGQIWVCDETRCVTLPGIEYAHAGDHPRRFQVRGVLDQWLRPDTAHHLDPEPELDILGGLLEHVRYRRMPHLVTVVGAPGIGKTRLLAEFKRRVMGRPTATRFMVGKAQAPADDGLAVHRELLSAYCGTAPGVSAEAAGRRLEEMVRRVVHVGETARWMVTVLGPLLRPAFPAPAVPLDRAEIMDAFRMLLTAEARDDPLVMIIDDLHLAEDGLLDFVEDVSGASEGVSLLVVVAARRELFDRRPGWGGGLRLLTTLTMGLPATGAGWDGVRAGATEPALCGPGSVPWDHTRNASLT
ncbi:AAA family ATPase [Actinomadura graeca]|uniref:AAA family ATPase n=1 Tax=Actinomadura graeca TaxID=2750812 RepID=A0ABX8QT02_9ACTN|nr:BTAD domain-containing putative transcriptional regulator [Actinomadura graeca]QXJ21841.1 AAA family ATPase [Actinomadura graeca]